MLQVEHYKGRAVAELLEHRRNHHRAEAHRVSGDHYKCDLKGQSYADETIIERGMCDRRRIVATDQIEYEIKRRENQDAPDGRDPEDDPGEFHAAIIRRPP